MAVKSKAQVLTLIQEVVELHDLLLTFLTGTFEAQFNLVSTAIAAGDDEDEDEDQLTALREVLSNLGDANQSTIDLVTALNATLGRFALNADLGDVGQNVQAFHAKLIADAEAFLNRGYTKLAAGFVPNGANIGTPTFAFLLEDVNGDVGEGGRPETYTLRCVTDAVEGEIELGAETWELEGTAVGTFPWDEAGIGGDTDGAGYDRELGKGTKDFSESVLSIIAGEQFGGVGATAAAGNILLNGDFEEAFGSGATRIPRWTFMDGNEANVTEETVSPIAGDSSPVANGIFRLRQVIDSGMRTKTPFAYEMIVNGASGAANLTGTIVMRVLDANATVHATASLDLSTLAEGVDTKFPFKAFVLPVNVRGDLFFEIEITVIGGTTPTLIFDQAILGELFYVDGNFSARPMGGLISSRTNDEAVGIVASTDVGKNQRAFNKAFEGAYVKAAGAAVFWTDHA